MKGRVACPPCYSGPLAGCLCGMAPENRATEELRWHRAQMRSWAGHWRERHAAAALLGKSAEEVGRTHLSLAKSYRDAARRLAAREGAR